MRNGDGPLAVPASVRKSAGTRRYPSDRNVCSTLIAFFHEWKKTLLETRLWQNDD